MSLKLSCTGCRRLLRVPTSRAGCSVRCPACGDVIHVPKEEGGEVSLAKTFKKNHSRPPALPAVARAKSPSPHEVSTARPPKLPTRPSKPPSPVEAEPQAGAVHESSRWKVDTSPPEVVAKPPRPQEPESPPDIAPTVEPEQVISSAAPIDELSPIEPNQALPGMEHPRYRVRVVRQLVSLWVIVALLNLAPAVWVMVVSYRDMVPAPNWAYVVLVLGTVMLAGALYALQIPDWSTLWTITMMSVGIATLYAAALSLSALAPSESQIAGALDLNHYRSKAPLWCFMIMSVMLLVTYLVGRTSHAWRRAVKEA